MALGTHLTIQDYFGNRNISKMRVGNLTNRTMRFQKRKFEAVLSSCHEAEKKTGLTASDYLANPVHTSPPAGPLTRENRSGWRLSGSVRQKEPVRRLDIQVYEKREAESRGTDSVKESIEQGIQKAARTYGLPPELIRAVIQAESHFQVKAVSSAGAQGLMQLMPGTAKELGVKDPFDIDQNIDGGSRYLKNMLDRFGGDLKSALSAYNAGPGTVEHYHGDVPYPETKQYVERVLKFSGLNA